MLYVVISIFSHYASVLVSLSRVKHRMVLLNIYDLYDLPPVNVIDTVLYIFIVVTVLLLAYYFKGCS